MRTKSIEKVEFEALQTLINIHGAGVLSKFQSDRYNDLYYELNEV